MARIGFGREDESAPVEDLWALEDATDPVEGSPYTAARYLGSTGETNDSVRFVGASWDDSGLNLEIRHPPGADYGFRGSVILQVDRGNAHTFVLAKCTTRTARISIRVGTSKHPPHDILLDLTAGDGEERRELLVRYTRGDGETIDLRLRMTGLAERLWKFLPK